MTVGFGGTGTVTEAVTVGLGGGPVGLGGKLTVGRGGKLGTGTVAVGLGGRGGREGAECVWVGLGGRVDLGGKLGAGRVPVGLGGRDGSGRVPVGFSTWATGAPRTCWKAAAVARRVSRMRVILMSVFGFVYVVGK